MTQSSEQAERLRECPDCGLFQHVPELRRGTVALCPRCHAVLRRQRTDPHGRALAMAVTGLLLFAVASQAPFLDMEYLGRDRASTLVTGPLELEHQGLWMLSVVVLVTTVAAPLAKMLAMSWVLIGLRLPHPPRHLYIPLRWVELLGPWSMIEVFLLGVFVAYTKLGDFAQVHVGLAVYAMGGLMLAMALADTTLDHPQLWDELERAGAIAAPIPPAPTTEPARGSLVGCECCGLVSARPTDVGIRCPRCGTRLHRRKPDSLARTWALLAAAAILYFPANLLPVMTVISLGQGAPSTILQGVKQLAAAGMWPLALLVFFASIVVPVVKLFGLGSLMIATRRHARGRLRERTVLYRIVDSVGRWSMIDVFMVSILTALVRWDLLASVEPGPGVVAFCAVVILTMLAAGSFDPRLMWDAMEYDRRADRPNAARPGLGQSGIAQPDVQQSGAGPA